MSSSDACVLYPAPLRGFLLYLALSELFAAKWSDEIHEEWIGNLLEDRPDIVRQLKRTRALMDEAVPDSRVTGYQDLIPALNLPDPNDRHVLAAAIRCGAQAIVTFNLKDFPAETLDLYDTEAIHPDDFVAHQFCLRQERVLRRTIGRHWKNRPNLSRRISTRSPARGWSRPRAC